MGPARRSTNALIWLSGKRALKPVRRLAVLERVDHGDGLNAQLLGQRLVLVDVDLDHAHGAACGLTTFSRIGPSCLQGSHQGAQKSTMTGTSLDASMTSTMNPLVSLSLIKSAPPPVASFLPISPDNKAMLFPYPR